MMENAFDHIQMLFYHYQIALDAAGVTVHVQR